MKLVLASTSRYRRELLDRLGVAYVAAAHRCDESQAPAGTPTEVAATLADGKAASLASEYPAAHILGSDQVVDLDGAILGKPGTAEAALRQLEQLAGRTHRLITAASLRSPDGGWQRVVEVHTLRMRTLSAAERDRYVAAEAPLDCCGSYRIEGLGIALFERIEGGDFTAIVGLPLMAVAQMLRRAGAAIP